MTTMTTTIMTTMMTMTTMSMIHDDKSVTNRGNFLADSTRIVSAFASRKFSLMLLSFVFLLFAAAAVVVVVGGGVGVGVFVNNSSDAVTATFPCLFQLYIIT